MPFSFDSSDSDLKAGIGKSPKACATSLRLPRGVSALGWSHGASDFDDLVINLELLPCEEINTHSSLQTFGLLIN